VNPSVQVKTVPEFITYAKANSGKINMASAGIGSGNHIAGELFKMMAGVNLVHVPYRGAGPALVDLLGGQVQVMFATLSSSIEYVRAGKLRALAVTTTTRSDALPDVPTVSDFVPGYEASFWTGIGAPKDTPAEVVDTLNQEINAGLSDPKMNTRFEELGATALAGSPADFKKLIADETEKSRKVVKFSGAKADCCKKQRERYETSPSPISASSNSRDGVRRPIHCRATDCLFGVDPGDHHGCRRAEGERRQLSVAAYSTDRRLPARLRGRHHHTAHWRCHEHDARTAAGRGSEARGRLEHRRRIRRAFPGGRLHPVH